ncbi:hypothetical protein MPER_13838, partial [Moniliophthora perniciosa FA553]
WSGADTIDDAFRGTEEEYESYLAQWLEDGKAMRPHNGINGGIKLQPNAKDLKGVWPTFEECWEDFYPNSPCGYFSTAYYV